MKAKKEIIKAIIRMPVIFKIKNISAQALLKESGYLDIYEEISENEIATELLEYPDYVDNWFDWSDNKRTSSGWYLKVGRNQKYYVGYYPNVDDKKLLEYKKH